MSNYIKEFPLIETEDGDLVLPKRRFSFTLLELCTVVVIAGILAAFVVPSFVKMQGKVLDNEAKAQLLLIQSAEKVYRIGTGLYVACNSNAGCNTILNMSVPLSVGDGGNWDYRVVNVDNTLSPPIFEGQAVGAGTSDWKIDQDGIITSF